MAIDTAKDSISISEAEKDLRAIIARARETKQPVFITQDSGAAVIVLDATQYLKDLDERDVLHAILDGRRAIREDGVQTLEEVEAQIDALLSEPD